MKYYVDITIRKVAVAHGAIARQSIDRRWFDDHVKAEEYRKEAVIHEGDRATISCVSCPSNNMADAMLAVPMGSDWNDPFAIVQGRVSANT